MNEEYTGKTIYVHTNTGQPKYTIDWPWTQETLDFLTQHGEIFTIGSKLPISEVWIEGGNILHRDYYTQPLSISRGSILNDGVDYSEISNAPPNSKVMVYSTSGTVELQTNSEGRTSLSTTTEGLHSIELGGRYISDTHVISAAPLSYFKESKWEQVKTSREAHKVAGTSTPKGRIDTSASSQIAINSYAIQAQNNPDFIIDWTMEDNSVVSHNSSEFLALQASMVSHINACQSYGTTLRALIDSSNTLVELEAIDIESGWPT